MGLGKSYQPLDVAKYSTVGDVTSLHHDTMFSRRKLDSFGMMYLFKPDFLRNYKSFFNCILVPNVAKNMADLINIKQCIFIPYFAGRLRHLKGG
jgi:hypothetical protein